ncbi:UNVERIFIED_CONTAM: hypothetical protein NCL1_12082 [Trichonephila clavipes]
MFKRIKYYRFIKYFLIFNFLQEYIIFINFCMSLIHFFTWKN